MALVSKYGAAAPTAFPFRAHAALAAFGGFPLETARGDLVARADFFLVERVMAAGVAS